MRKVRRFEEVVLEDGGVGERRSTYYLDDDGSIYCPEGQLTQEQHEEWERVIKHMKNWKLDHIIDGLRLFDHCKQYTKKKD